MTRAIDWWFLDRTSGRYVIGQFPNVVLWVFLAATAFGWLVDSDSVIGHGSRLVATLALGWWASAEMWSGVNPFRRALGIAAGVVVTMRILGGW